MKPQLTTYQNYLNSKMLTTASGIKDHADAIIEHFWPIHSRFAPATYLVDFATKKYIYVEENCFNFMGYTAQWFLEMGLEAYLSKMYPPDFHILNAKIFPDNLSFLKTLPLDHYQDHIFSYNYRISNLKGNYVTVLQRFSYIPGAIPAQPAGEIEVAFDITHFKNDTSIVHTIEKVVSTPGGNVTELVFKKIHPVYEEVTDALLSKRETEILRLMAEGMCSKQIAGKKNLSINTINNHRKNMLCKTNCKSSSELMNYAVKHGLI